VAGCASTVLLGSVGHERILLEALRSPPVDVVTTRAGGLHESGRYLDDVTLPR